jgi:hypothetical protein
MAGTSSGVARRIVTAAFMVFGDGVIPGGLIRQAMT